MKTELLTAKYANELDGVLSCFDRIVVTGSLSPFCYAQGMTKYLYSQGIRIFDYVQFAEPLRDEIRANAEAVAQANGLTIEYIRKNDFRKEERIQEILGERGSEPGLVHIIDKDITASSRRLIERTRQMNQHDSGERPNCAGLRPSP